MDEISKRHAFKTIQILLTFSLAFSPAAFASEAGSITAPKGYNTPLEEAFLYDTQTRSELQTSHPFPSLNNQRNNLMKNPDRSIDIFFGPKPPPGTESDWIETVPDKSWFVILRLYGPLDPWFDKTWRPGEIEKVN